MRKKNNQLNRSKLKEAEHVLVYSTDPMPEKRCNNCQQFVSKCVCSSSKIQALAAIKLKLQFEKKGRAGKLVTLLTRLPADETFLRELCAFLKKAVGSGGTHYLKNGEGVVEIQGDWRKELITLAQGYLDKKAIK